VFFFFFLGGQQTYDFSNRCMDKSHKCKACIRDYRVSDSIALE